MCDWVYTGKTGDAKLYLNKTGNIYYQMEQKKKEENKSFILKDAMNL